ncbi:hypothetical protein J2W34_000733 [Variovorax boronicumulans]|uniref:hypothetical protein n=1 Tax=Variovorax boronicumulans TaxID=436515 RepID=UPI0027882EDD|nr:hypothetical protein [Variovorax boronicumulans]MDQ0068959.1 hypothetical protein [Variovorax boronicumulans]
MAGNIYQQFFKLLPRRSRQVGTIVAMEGDVAAVELPGGGLLTVVGVGAVGDQVFVRDGVIEGQAPAMTPVVIEI